VISFVHMFAKHRVAANLLMVIMIIAGFIGVDRLRTQFFPSFELGQARPLKTSRKASLSQLKTQLKNSLSLTQLTRPASLGRQAFELS